MQGQRGAPGSEGRPDGAGPSPGATAAAEVDAPRPLAGGLVLRQAGPADVEGIVAVETAAFGPGDEPGVRSFLTGPGADPGRWTVVVDGDRVVAASALLPLRLRYDGVDLPAAQVEYVATDPAHRRRGLVRAQFERHHARADALGVEALFIGGIPYLYRRFGYGYGVDYPEVFTFDRARLAPPADVVVRAATEADVPALDALEALRPDEGLRVVRGPEHWHRWLSMASVDGHERFFVAERAGSIVGWSLLSFAPDDARASLAPAVVADPGVTEAIVAHALDEAGPGEIVIGLEAPGTPHGEHLHRIGTPVPYGLGLYVRIPDPVSLLDRLRPVLTRRLAASPLAGIDTTVEISLYDAGVALDIADGEVVAVRAIPGVEDPFDDQGIGVAPDWLPALVFGRWGASGLAERADDVTLGRHRAVMDALFPKRSADLVADF